METWLLILISISVSLVFKSVIRWLTSGKAAHRRPPGPPSFPIIGNVLWLKKNSFSDFQHILQTLHATHGPIVTFQAGSRPSIWVADRSLAHQALVQSGAVFADRPPALATTRVITSNQHDIHSSFYGPTWRLLRRNFTAEILNPSRVKSYAHARRWVLQILMECLISEQNESGHLSRALDHFRYSMFCLLVLMCFGDKLNQTEIKEIEDAQYKMLMSYGRFGILNFWPGMTKFLLRKRWEEFMELRKYQENVLIRLIKARKKVKKEKSDKSKVDKEHVLAYVDTLLDLELPEEKRKLTDGEMVSLCSEFLNAGTDPTATALQWIMANMVKYPHIQQKLYMEIKGVVGDGAEEVKEDDLQKMPYLKAVVLEGLRRHPPGHFLSSHRVTEDTVLGGFLVPKQGTINFMVAEMGRDPKVWEDPMAFKPERFLSSKDGSLEGIDITGSREIKMMPFGAGRRICPGYSLAMLHLEYFLANLVWSFEWKAVDGHEVDLSEKQQFITMVMKNPFRAHISPRRR